jgi:Fe2+ transport system protein FeoA
MREDGMTTLSNLPVGRRARVSDVAEQPLRVRMASMGLRAGVEIIVVARSASGSRLVRVGDARLSVARELAAGIQVEVLDVQ